MINIDKEIQKARAELAKEQRLWRTERATLTHQVKGLTATKDHLEQEVAETREELASQRLSLTELNQQAQVAAEGLGSVLIATEKAQHQLRLAVEEQEILQSQTQTQRTMLSATLEQWRLQQQATLEEQLDGLRQDKADAAEDLRQVQSQVASAQTQVLELQIEAARLQTQAKSQASGDRRKLAELRATITQTTTDLTAVEQKLQQASDAYKRTSSLTAKAQQNYEKFIAYEEKAWKLLRVKDQELQERLDHVATSEQFLETRRSFLPPL